MTVSKILGLAAVAAAIAATSVPAMAYQRDGNRGTAYNQRQHTNAFVTPRHSDKVVVTPRRIDAKVVVITRDHDDRGWHRGHKNRFWKRLQRWNGHHHQDNQRRWW